MSSGMLRLLDLFCCAGGATRGYQLAGFEVTGVDISYQPNYCGDEFHQGDALEYVRMYGHMFDAIHASPPCQAYSLTQRIQNNRHPDLIAQTRGALTDTGLPYVIENVVGAPLIGAEMLCGAMFGLRTYRHRLFEPGNGFWLTPPMHPEHMARQAKMGRPVADDEYIQVVGNFTGVKLAREVMGLPGATRDELREAIPAAYTKYVGTRLYRQIETVRRGGPIAATMKPEPVEAVADPITGVVAFHTCKGRCGMPVRSVDGGATWQA
jgi:DNA (cytosine-5)-methyltransferase 1